MTESIFNPKNQVDDLPGKIIVGLERISQAMKALLWDKAKVLELSPIQIQILIFIAYHKTAFNTVSYLANEFNLTKSTISDAVKALNKKELLIKSPTIDDSRSYSLSLTKKGSELLALSENFILPFQKTFDKLEKNELLSIYTTLSKLIFELNQKGILTVQRTCYACKFYDQNNHQAYCHLLNKPLADNDIRLDCEEFDTKEN